VLDRILSRRGSISLLLCLATLLGAGISLRLSDHAHGPPPSAAEVSVGACGAGNLDTPGAEPQACSICLVAKSLRGWQASSAAQIPVLPSRSTPLQSWQRVWPVRSVQSAQSRAPPEVA